MKRLITALLCLSLILGISALPVSATAVDVTIDTPDAPFPADTTIEGDLILTGDCPETVILVNVVIEGTLYVETDHSVTVHLQGDSSCNTAELTARTNLVGGTIGEVLVDASYASFKNTTIEKLELRCEDGIASIGGSVSTLTLSEENIYAGGTGRVEKTVVDGTDCTVNLRSGDFKKNVSDPVKPQRNDHSVKASFVIDPTVSPTNSVINAKVTFTYVPEEFVGDYRIYWYIGDTLSYYDWHYTLESGATTELACSAHFTGEMDEVLPVWVRLVNNDTESELRFVSKVNVVGYTNGEYEGMENYDYPYSVHLLRNQNVIVIYGMDENGEYTKPINVFLCSTGYWNETELGDFEIGLQMRWGALMLDLYGQYSSQFNYNQLFHSVPYWSADIDNIEWEEYEKLGTAASSGCVRLSVIDAKWIYDHCHTGAPVKVYDVEELPVEKPIQCIIREDSIYRGWDPTDPDPDNPTKSYDPPTLSVLKVGHKHPVYSSFVN